jgi:hypothetical protein
MVVFLQTPILSPLFRLLDVFNPIVISLLRLTTENPILNVYVRASGHCFGHMCEWEDFLEIKLQQSSK